MATLQLQEANEANEAETSLGWRLQRQGAHMVGKAIYTLWPEDAVWYPAEIISFDNQSGFFG